MGVVWCVQISPASQDNEKPLAPGAVRIYAEFEFDEAQQGPPGHAHGGASAAVIDEAMGAVVWQSGLRALLANLNLNYRLPVPLHTPLRAEAWLERVEGRKAYARGQILVGDRVAVEGTGLFVHIPAFFSDYDQFPGPSE
jgi:acyl-coenzyme A thioesterase PaaI-like protein